SYAAAAFAFIRSYAALLEGRRLSRPVCLALIGGVLTGIATQTNPKGIADLVFFTCLLTGSVVLARKGTDTSEPLGEDTAKRNVLRALALLGVAIAGVLLVSIPFLICLWHSDSLGGYWNYVWRWGFRYSNYYPLTRVARRGFWVVAGYFVMNNTLAVALVFAGAPAIYQVWTTRGRWSGHRVRLLNTSDRSQESSASFRTDFRLLLWFGVSLLGVSAGGRFYSHYFFQILPALCLLGARGLISIVAAFKSGATLNSHRRILRRLALGLLVTGFFVTVVRYHSRTFWLAADWIRGRKSQATLTWYHETRNFDERRAAAFLKGLPDPAAAASDMGLEDIRTIPPPPQSFGDSPDTVFVWGYRPWIYYWSGLVPASKYLSAQPLTGIPAGSEYEPGAITPILEAEETSAARAELIKELTAAKPRFIVDEWGMYNPALGVNAYSDVRNFMTAYKPVWSAGNLMIYRRKRYTQTTSSQDGR
ncbi:MAG TPA: hypothetical protein VLZ81_04795, partial [Blastocatellia bacterium]|nr:hypothetical protein [Blastocatellia bacterium]